MTAYRPDDSPTSGKRALGFGCAGLYGLPEGRDRRAVLECAFDLGIRHFDVAPIYGLGRAEKELADFLRAHAKIRIATKFGITPTAIGAFAGRVQSPVRRLLQRSTATKSVVMQYASGPNEGALGRLLYSHRDYSVTNARHRLASSLRTLATERIEYFMLHEPAGANADDYGDLIDFLENQRGQGVIGDWGPAGDLSRMDAALQRFSSQATALQCPYDLISGYGGPQPTGGRPTITYGVISRGMPYVNAALSREPQLRQTCSELLDADLLDPRTVAALLLRDAIRHNQNGTVLLSTTSIDHLQKACAAANVAMRNEEQVASMIRSKCLAPRAKQ